MILTAAKTIVRRDLLLAMRRRGDVATALLFFVIVASLFPLGIGAEPNLLRNNTDQVPDSSDQGLGNPFAEGRLPDTLSGITG